MVRVLMRDHDRVQRKRVFAQLTNAFEGFATREAGVNEDARARSGDDGTVSFTATTQHHHANRHELQNSWIHQSWGVSSWLTTVEETQRALTRSARNSLSS